MAVLQQSKALKGVPAQDQLYGNAFATAEIQLKFLQTHLFRPNSLFCGCRKREIMASVGDNLTFIDGTCIEWIRSRKHRRDNTSGFRGVYKHGNKWRVSIGFKGKHYHIGTFDEFAEA